MRKIQNPKSKMPKYRHAEIFGIQNKSQYQNPNSGYNRTIGILKLFGVCCLGFGIYLILGLVHLDAAWWEVKSLPVPPHTEAVKEKTNKQKTSELDMVYYSSTLSANEISVFYRERLTKLGWKESNAFIELNKITGVKVSPELNKLSGSKIIFRKDNEIIVVKFVSEGEKTGFILGRNKMNQAGPNSMPGVTSRLKLSGRPRSDLAPVYPDAKLADFFGQPESFKAMYYSKDAPESIVRFFQSHMRDYGWAQSKEAPLKQRSAHGISISELNFSQSSGDTYNVYVFRQNPDYTVITVAYAKKR